MYVLVSRLRRGLSWFPTSVSESDGSCTDDRALVPVNCVFLAFVVFPRPGNQSINPPLPHFVLLLSITHHLFWSSQLALPSLPLNPSQAPATAMSIDKNKRPLDEDEDPKATGMVKKLKTEEKSE